MALVFISTNEPMVWVFQAALQCFLFIQRVVHSIHILPRCRYRHRRHGFHLNSVYIISIHLLLPSSSETQSAVLLQYGQVAVGNGRAGAENQRNLVPGFAAALVNLGFGNNLHRLLDAFCAQIVQGRPTGIVHQVGELNGALYRVFTC